MLTKIIAPESGQTSSEVTLVKWHKAIGDQVERGDLLFSIETDKAILDIESCGKGVLLETYYNENDTVPGGETVAYVGNHGEIPPVKAQAHVEETTAGDEDDEYRPIVKDNETTTKHLNSPLTANRTFNSDAGKQTASPLARRLAKSHNLNLSDIGIVAGVPVKRQDVDNYLTGINADDRPYTVQPLSKMRRTIARRMLESVNTIPAFTVSVDVDMKECMKFRKELNNNLSTAGVKISFNDIIMKCACMAVKTFPLINSAFTDNGIKVFNDVNFGLAIGLDTGLIVTIVKGANTRTIQEIAIANTENIELARQGKLLMENLSGGTITLSSLGAFGARSFTAIINPPESSILAVGEIADNAVVRNGRIVSRPVMTVTASFDHRVIDGAMGAAFLKELKTLLENPQIMNTKKEAVL